MGPIPDRSGIATRSRVFFALVALLTAWVVLDVVYYRGETARLARAENAADRLHRSVNDALYGVSHHSSGGGARLPGSAPRFVPRIAADIATFKKAMRSAGGVIASSQSIALQRDTLAVGMLADEIIARRVPADTLNARWRTLAVLAETRGRPVITALRGQLTRARTALNRGLERRLVAAGLLALGLLTYFGGGILLPLQRRLRHAEKALARAGAEAEAHEAHVMSAMAHAAHDIRTTLNGVTGMAGLLRRSGLDAQQRRFVTLMEQSGTTLLRLVNEMMDLAKVASGEMTLTTAPYDPVRLIVDTVSAFAPDLHCRGIRVLIDTDPGLPRRSLGDETRLRQVLSNLVHNAMKFTERGHVIVEARWMADLGLMEVIVSDTGPGVTPEHRDRIFGAYKQVGNGQARGEGTGLGLALARQIVARLGGDMGVRAATGGGAAFWFRVPLSASTRPAGTEGDTLDATAIRLAVDWPPLAAMLARHLSARGAVIAAGEMAAALTIQPAAGSDTGPALALKPVSSRFRPVTLAEPVDPDQLFAAVRDALQDGPRLAVATASDTPSLPGREAPLALTADDSEINRLVTAALLADAGWRVETARDGAAAVEAARRLQPALILLDLSMPKLDGLAAARAIRALPLPPGETPPAIFAATGHDDPGTAEAVRRAGMDGLLVKPLTAANLAQALNGRADRLQRAG